MEILNIVSGVQESDDYPYGRQTCHITFQTEFKAKKGFRFVTQTTNPKTGRINKPKRSTYSDFMCLHRAENGHIKNFSMSLHGYGDIAQMVEFLTLHDIEFTEEQSAFLWVVAISCIRGNAHYTRLKEGVEIKQFLETTKAAAMIEAFKNGANFNEIKNIGYDLDAINALCENKQG